MNRHSARRRASAANPEATQPAEEEEPTGFTSRGGFRADKDPNPENPNTVICNRWPKTETEKNQAEAERRK
jgi:hypothetical protein